MAASFPIPPPIEPMLARLAEALPPGDFLYEPKWDGFRAIVLRGGGDDVYIQSRDSRPLNRYFPELSDALREKLPRHCVSTARSSSSARMGSTSTRRS